MTAVGKPICSMVNPRNAGPILSVVGAISRNTPYFKGKWRLTDWLFHRWLKHKDYSEVIELNAGIKIRCDLWDEVPNSIWWHGTSYEQKGSDFLRKILRPGMVFLDVGAHVGYYSLLAVSELGGQIHVHAFEPVDNTHRAFCENVERNRLQNIRVNKLIVSDTRSPQSIYVHESWNSGVSSIFFREGSTCRPEEVESITLDAYCARENLARVDVIKLDVEGHELSVLKGAVETLAQRRPVLLMEVKDEALGEAHVSRAALYDFLAGAGYQAYAITNAVELRPILQPVEGNLIVFKPSGGRVEPSPART